MCNVKYQAFIETWILFIALITPSLLYESCKLQTIWSIFGCLPWYFILLCLYCSSEANQEHTAVVKVTNQEQTTAVDGLTMSWRMGWSLLVTSVSRKCPQRLTVESSFWQQEFTGVTKLDFELRKLWWTLLRCRFPEMNVSLLQNCSWLVFAVCSLHAWYMIFFHVVSLM